MSLKDEFKLIVQDFEDNEDAGCLDLETMRMRHLDLASVVSEVDGKLLF